MSGQFDEPDILGENDEEGGVSPRIGLPRKGPIDSTNLCQFKRKQSKSILCCIGIDNTDAGGFLENEEPLEDGGAAEFFQYNMNNKDRGIFVIFNHKNFTIPKAGKRNGTDNDRENLFETARNLGFTVFTHDNLTRDQLMKEVRRYAETDYSDCDCFACAILTHGESGDLLYAKDSKYSIKDVMSPFKNCQSLFGKPKLFFIQACRGNTLDSGITSKKEDSMDAGGFSDDTSDDRTCIPIEADFFIGYSTVEGYFAWRNNENGSWFIQALCFCLRKYGDSLELMQIMTRVNRMVAYDYESNTSNPKCNKKKQMPSIVTRLTGDVYFCRREDTIDAPTKAIRLPFGRISKTAHDEKQELFLKTQLLRAKIELSKIRIEKAEAEKREQEILERVLEYELRTLG